MRKISKTRKIQQSGKVDNKENKRRQTNTTIKEIKESWGIELRKISRVSILGISLNLPAWKKMAFLTVDKSLFTEITRVEKPEYPFLNH